MAYLATRVETASLYLRERPSGQALRGHEKGLLVFDEVQKSQLVRESFHEHPRKHI